MGLLTDASGFPLSVAAFEGNKAETATMLPVIETFKTAHQLTDVTVVADAGMISESNQIALQAAGLSFILGARIPFLPGIVAEWHTKHSDQPVPDQLVLTQPWPATSSEKARGIPDRVVHYQYRADRARRSLRGIDEQIAKAQRAVDGKAAIKRNRFIQLTGATKSVNRELEAKNAGAVRVEGLHHQPDLQQRRLRNRGLSPALARGEEFPDVQARPGRPPDLFPHPRFHRRTLKHRVRRTGGLPLDRDPNRLEHQEIRADRPPLPHHHHRCRQTNPHRRRTATRRPRPRTGRDPPRRCALI